MAESTPKLALRDARSPSTSTISSTYTSISTAEFTSGPHHPQCNDDIDLFSPLPLPASPTPSSEYSFNFNRRNPLVSDRKRPTTNNIQRTSEISEEDYYCYYNSNSNNSTGHPKQRNALALKSLSLPIPTSPIDALSFPKLPGQRLPQAQVFYDTNASSRVSRTPRQFEEDRRRLISTSHTTDTNMHYSGTNKQHNRMGADSEPRVCTPAPSFWKAAALFESADVCDAHPQPILLAPEAGSVLVPEERQVGISGTLRHLSLKRENVVLPINSNNERNLHKTVQERVLSFDSYKRYHHANAPAYNNYDTNLKHYHHHHHANGRRKHKHEHEYNSNNGGSKMRTLRLRSRAWLSRFVLRRSTTTANNNSNSNYGTSSAATARV